MTDDPVDPTDTGDEVDGELDDDEPTPGSKTPRPPGPHDRRIGAVVGQLLDDRGWDYTEFCNRIRPAHENERWNKNRIGRLIRGERRISLTELADVTATLGVSREEFLDRAGYIRLPDDLISRIMVEPDLGTDGRNAILAVLDSVRRRPS